MSIKLIRRTVPFGTSEQDKIAYNIPVYADEINFRYAFNGIDGIIKGYGNELNHIVVGNNFNIGNGMGVVDGAAFEITGSGFSYNAPISSALQSIFIYIEIDKRQIGNESANIIGYTTPQNIPANEDLTINPNGFARRLLYTFSVQNGIITNVRKYFRTIERGNSAVWFDGNIAISTSANGRTTNTTINGNKNISLEIGDTIEITMIVLGMPVIRKFITFPILNQTYFGAISEIFTVQFEPRSISVTAFLTYDNANKNITIEACAPLFLRYDGATLRMANDFNNQLVFNILSISIVK